MLNNAIYIFHFYASLPLNIVEQRWNIIINDKKSTCVVDLPFNGDTKPNVILSLRAESLDACRSEATYLADEDERVNFFFWSSNPHPLGKPSTSNCYAFQTCSEKDRISLSHPGYTYEVKEGKRGFFYY